MQVRLLSHRKIVPEAVVGSAGIMAERIDCFCCNVAVGQHGGEGYSGNKHVIGARKVHVLQRLT